MAVDLACRDRRIAVDEARLRALVDLVAAGEGRALAVSISIVDDAEIRRLNREFLGHDEPTDVIAFDLDDGPGPCGEVVASAECAERVALELGHPPESELFFYVCHGLLHLCGWDDAAPEDRARMLARQRVYLERLGMRVG